RPSVQMPMKSAQPTVFKASAKPFRTDRKMPMLRHACGFALANAGHDTPRAAELPQPQEHPAHGALHGAGVNAVQEFLARLALLKPCTMGACALRISPRWLQR